jgi:riboflavin biosynthesis pyrimidine reductase
MSTNEFQRTDDEIVSLLSQWLMKTLGNDELRKRIEEVGTDELAALAREGVQSLLLEGGPTLAGAFLEADLVDKLCVFVAPVLAGGGGPSFLPPLGSVRRLAHLVVRPIGGDALLQAYVHEP